MSHVPSSFPLPCMANPSMASAKTDHQAAFFRCSSVAELICLTEVLFDILCFVILIFLFSVFILIALVVKCFFFFSHAYFSQFLSILNVISSRIPSFVSQFISTSFVALIFRVENMPRCVLDDRWVECVDACCLISLKSTIWVPIYRHSDSDEAFRNT